MTASNRFSKLHSESTTPAAIAAGARVRFRRTSCVREQKL
jgi:hypothetical protein